MLKSLTSLRGIFILFIFFHHCLGLYPGGGTMAVAFFFVLGGFSMTLGYKDRVTASDFCYKEYILRRCIKFYPLHWICLLAALPIAFRPFLWTKIPLFFINATLLQSWFPVERVYFSFNAVSWYLSDTIFFALIFPTILKYMVRTTPGKRVLLAVSIIFAYASIAFAVPLERRHPFLYICPLVRLADFLLGVYLALGYTYLKGKSIRINRLSGYLGSLAMIALLVAESYVLPENARLIAAVYWPFVSALIIIASLSDTGEGYYGKSLYQVGKISFTIFMTHLLILDYAQIAFKKILHMEIGIIYVVFSLVMTMALSFWVARYIQKPITRWMTERARRSTTVQS